MFREQSEALEVGYTLFMALACAFNVRNMGSQPNSSEPLSSFALKVLWQVLPPNVKLSKLPSREADWGASEASSGSNQPTLTAAGMLAHAGA